MRRTSGVSAASSGATLISHSRLPPLASQLGGLSATLQPSLLLRCLPPPGLVVAYESVRPPSSASLPWPVPPPPFSSSWNWMMFFCFHSLARTLRTLSSFFCAVITSIRR